MSSQVSIQRFIYQYSSATNLKGTMAELQALLQQQLPATEFKALQYEAEIRSKIYVIRGLIREQAALYNNVETITDYLQFLNTECKFDESVHSPFYQLCLKIKILAIDQLLMSQEAALFFEFLEFLFPQYTVSVHSSADAKEQAKLIKSTRNTLSNRFNALSPSQQVQPLAVSSETTASVQILLESYIEQVFTQLNINPLTVLEELEVLYRNLNT